MTNFIIFMTQQTINSLSELPEDATPEEQILCRMNELYSDYHNSENEQLINSRKQMITRLYQIRTNR